MQVRSDLSRAPGQQDLVTAYWQTRSCETVLCARQPERPTVRSMSCARVPKPPLGSTCRQQRWAFSLRGYQQMMAIYIIDFMENLHLLDRSKRSENSQRCASCSRLRSLASLPPQSHRQSVLRVEDHQGLFDSSRHLQNDHESIFAGGVHTTFISTVSYRNYNAT